MDQLNLSYNDISLIPNYSRLKSRSLADTSIELFGRKFLLPITPSNMTSVIDFKISKFLSQNNYFYIYHRFGKKEDDLNFDKGLTNHVTTKKFIKLSNEQNFKLISISTGVNDDTLDDLKYIKKNKFKVDFLTIDVAQGFHEKVKNRIKWIKKNLPNVKIIAGNVVTGEACEKLGEWGTDIIKCCISSGSICSTRYVTGFYVPMFSCIQQCADQFYIVNGNEMKERQFLKPVIADGGIAYIGDINKALVAGATAVMIGKLFAQCVDSPAKIIDGKKQYFGSTSFEAKGNNNHVEGKLLEIESGCTYKERLEEISQGIRSGISYAGGNNLSCFKNVEYLVLK